MKRVSFFVFGLLMLSVLLLVSDDQQFLGSTTVTETVLPRTEVYLATGEESQEHMLSGEVTTTITVTPTILVNTDNEFVIQTLEKACEIEEQAIWTFETKDFATVFVNDPRFPVPPDTLSFVQSIMNDTSITDVGYLDYRLAYFQWRKEGALRWNTISEKMKMENRNEMTVDERATLMSPTGVMYPPPPSPELKGNVPCTYAIQSVTIEKDIATVVAARGATTDEWKLVKRDDGRWYIAARRVILKHP